MQMKATIGIGVVLLLAVSGVSTHATNQTAADSSASAREAKILAAFSYADLVFVGVVREIGPAPPPMKGLVQATQSVTYEIDQILKGAYDKPRITVQHKVVAGSRNARADALAPDLFAAGKRLIVACRQRDPQVVDLDANVGTLEASASNMQLVNRLLGRR